VETSGWSATAVSRLVTGRPTCARRLFPRYRLSATIVAERVRARHSLLLREQSDESLRRSGQQTLGCPHRTRKRGSASAGGSFLGGCELAEGWLRGLDLNQRPLGYEKK
jgi:hypothetical protein